MTPSLEFTQLNANQLAALKRALRHVRAAAAYLDLSVEEACTLLVALECHGRRGGLRKSAGRPATEWERLTGHDLPSLPLRLVIQKAIHRSRFGDELTDQQAFRQLLEADVSDAEAKKHYIAMRKALRKPAKAELDRHKQNQAIRRQRRARGENQNSD